MRFELEEESFVLVIGDTHCAWRSHHVDTEAHASFQRLFDRLKASPDEKRPIANLTVLV